MTTPELASVIIGGIMFLAWIVSMYFWMKRGCPMPRWLHGVALAAFVIGVAPGACLVVLGGRPIWFALACELGCPAGIYTGWLWMSGPEWAERDKTG